MRTACVSLLFVLSTSSFAFAQERPEQRRPCGPGKGRNLIRLFVPQGLLGADFKPACRIHDHDYTVPGASKLDADREFLERLNCACDQSLTPRLCRWLTHVMYAAVRSPLSHHFYHQGQFHP